MAGIGHNGGPEMTGTGWRRHCWQAAGEALLPHLPIEVLRGRVRRAQELGLDYKTYASVRAASGHDVVAFLFSSNALRATPELPEDRAARLAGLQACGRLALTLPPLTPEALMQAGAWLIDATHPAPRPFGSFAEARAARLAAIGACGRLALTLAPLTPEALVQAAGGLIDAAHPAPRPFGSFAEARAAIRAARGGFKADGVVLVGDAPFEPEWCAAGKLAFYLPAARIFG